MTDLTRQAEYAMAYLAFLAGEGEFPPRGGLSGEEAQMIRHMAKGMALHAHVPESEFTAVQPERPEGMTAERAREITDEMQRLAEKAFARRELWL